MSTEPPVVFDDDNPEWTEEDFARAKPLSAYPELEAALRGAGMGKDDEQVSLRIDRDVLARFRAGGPGWQARINEALRKAAP